MTLSPKDTSGEHLTISQELFRIFEAVKATGKMRSLVQFQSNYKFYLMACHEVASRKLGHVAANFDKQSFEVVSASYGDLLKECLSVTPKKAALIKSFMAIYAFFSKKVTEQDKANFQEVIQLYKDGKAQSLAVLELLKNWANRFHEEYVVAQSLLKAHQYSESA